MHIQSQRGREVMQTIRTALMQHWDPISVAHIPEAADEYDSYVGPFTAFSPAHVQRRSWSSFFTARRQRRWD
jgi:hypothetical protein